MLTAGLEWLLASCLQGYGCLCRFVLSKERESASELTRLFGSRSALAVLASSSGVSEERAAFMDLVTKEIDRLNQGLQTRGATSLIFQSGNVHVRL